MANTENASSQSDLAVWFIPGFQTGPDDKTQEEVLESLRPLYPEGTTLKAIPWNALPVSTIDILRNWQNCLIATDNEAANLVDRIQEMPLAQQKNLILIGHSLGGNIVIKTAARCLEKNIQIRQMILLGAAIDNDAPEIEKAVMATMETNYSFVNMKDYALNMFYRIFRKKAALGTGYIKKADGSKFQEIFSDQRKEHKVLLYIRTFAKCVKNNCFRSQRIIVPQDRCNFNMDVANRKVFWQLLESYQGWELQQHNITTHCRIINPQNKREAWGQKPEMQESFERVKEHLADANSDSGANPPAAFKGIDVPQGNINANLGTAGGKVWWNELKNYKGWKLQKNIITGLCRILDQENVRRSWGGEDKMKAAFEEVKRQLDEKN